MTARKTKAPPRAKPEPKQALRSATAMHFTYSPEAGVVRVNVQQDALLFGVRERHGRDFDHPLKELPAGIRNSLERVFEQLAEHSNAAPFKPKAKDGK